MDQNSSILAISAIVHALFRPIGYVLAHAYLLLPATWHADPNEAPTIGGLVTVDIPHGKLIPQMLPLVARPMPDAGDAATATPETVSSGGKPFTSNVAGILGG